MAADKRVLLVALGGTVSMTAGASADSPVAPRLGVRDLLPTGAIDIEIETCDLRQLPGASLDWAVVGDLLQVIAEADRAGIAGVVIVQGTDTLEEVAFALELCLAGRTMPVVLTGAMRHADEPGADGPANVSHAIAVAASEKSRGMGVLIVMANVIHSSRFVRKSNSHLLHAFESAPGALGWVVEGEPMILMRPTELPPLPVAPDFARPSPRVALYRVSFADGGEGLDVLADSAALVVEAFGVGHVPEGIVDRLESVADRIPVYFSSRTGSGPTAHATYGFRGSETDLAARGLRGSGHLDGTKTRIALTLLLSGGADRGAIADYVARSFDRPRAS